MSRSPSVPLALAGGLLLASLVPAVPFFLDPSPFREVAGTGIHLSLYGLALAAMLALLVAVPRLGSLTSTDGQRLPDGLLTGALLATALYAATQFVQVSVTPDLADTAPVALDETGGFTMVALIGSWLLFLVAWVLVAAVGMRRRVLPMPAGVLLVLGAVAQPLIGPLAALPLGAGLLLVARSTATRGTGALVEPSAVAA
jgi:hypothetical protein